MRYRANVALCTVIAVATYLLLVAALLVIGRKAHLTLSDQTDTRINIGIILAGSVIAFALWVVVVFVYFRDLLEPEYTISPLYGPLLGLATTLALYTTIAGLQANDLARHHLTRHNMALYEPEVRWFQSIVLVGVFYSLGWLLYKIVRGPRWTPGRAIALAALCASVALVVIVVYVASLRLDH